MKGSMKCPNGYAHITNETECRSIATKEDKEFLKGHYASEAVGCTQYSNKIVFSTVAGSWTHPQTSAVCEIGE